MEIFSSRDMIRQQLIEYAESYIEITAIDLAKTSYLSYLINALSVLTANLIYYNTATYREFFLIRAQQKESVLNLAAMIGYTPTVAHPATSTVLLSIPTEFASSVGFTMYGLNDPDHTAFKFYAGDIVFSLQNEVRFRLIMDRGRPLAATINEIVRYSDEDNNYTVGIHPIRWRFSSDRKVIYFSVNVTQVEEVTEKFVFPRMRPYEFHDQSIAFEGEFAGINLSTTALRTESVPVQTTGDDVIYNLVQVEEDRVWWEDKASLFLISPGDYAYTYRVNETGIRLSFGNDIIGTQPTEGNVGTAIISVTKGYDGNVIAGTIVSADKIYIDVEYSGGITRSLPVLMKCINTEPAIGGTNYPTIDEIRNNAIVQVSTNERLVTQYDYENVSGIVEDLPIQHSFPILKRSDLKRNEITLFTDIIFMNQYVPTRNSVIKLKYADIVDQNGVDIIGLKAGDIVTIDPSRYESLTDFEDVDYVMMYDVDINTTTSVATYYYVLDHISTTPALKEYYVENESIILPTTLEFEVLNNEPGYTTRQLRLKLYYQHISAGVNGYYPLDELVCKLEMNEDGEFLDLVAYDTTGEDGVPLTWFQITIDMDDIDQGDVYFDFQFTTSNTQAIAANAEKICNADTNTVIKQNLDDFMYSKVKMYWGNDATSNPDDWGLMYDVPLMKKDYLDFLTANNQIDNFIQQIVHRIVTFDMTDYRMLTDSVNLKFSNTTGKLTNMNFNPVNKGFITGIDPTTLPDPFCPTCGYAYAVTNNTNYWASENWVEVSDGEDNTVLVDVWSKIEGGFIARYSLSEPGNWVFTTLNTNDIVYYDPENTSDPEQSTKMIFNGNNLHSVTKDIPLEFEAIVWVDSNFPMSENAFINTIKSTIANHYMELMGYDHTLYISDLTSVIQQIDGVLYCDIKKPAHDIFFDYEFDNFSHEDLLRYSPQLVYLDTNHMSITIRKR
jgi:hypothetical protein